MSGAGHFSDILRMFPMGGLPPNEARQPDDREADSVVGGAGQGEPPESVFSISPVNAAPVHDRAFPGRPRHSCNLVKPNLKLRQLILLEH